MNGIKRLLKINAETSQPGILLAYLKQGPYMFVVGSVFAMPSQCGRAERPCMHKQICISIDKNIQKPSPQSRVPTRQTKKTNGCLICCHGRQHKSCLYW